jgi:Ca2+-binding EF-hand superfamily protein
MKMTPFLERKLEHKFYLLDVDGNGVLEAADFERVIDILASERDWPEGHPRYIQLATTNRELWRALFDFCDRNEDGQVTMEEWMDFHANAIYYERNVGHEMPGIGRTLDTMAAFFYELLDGDGDGTVNRDDYVEFCAAHRVAREDAQKSFARMDRNQDGKLSREEVMLLVQEFYFSEDPEAPGNCFFGAL